MRENAVENYLNREARKVGALPMKFVSPGLRGVPDRIVLFPGGLVVFVELKASGGKARPQQLYRMRQLIDRDAIVRIVDTTEKVDALIKEWGVLG